MIQLDHADMSVAADALEARAADMSQRRAAIAASVDALLGTWRGEAADRFSTLWLEWRSSADAVIASLASDAAGIRYARTQLDGADQVTREAHARLAGRLG